MGNNDWTKRDGSLSLAGIKYWRGNWTNGTLYAPGDGVYVSTTGKTYICTLEHTAVTATNKPETDVWDTYWDIVASGPTGPTGYTGYTGPQGATGYTGYTGPSGSALNLYQLSQNSSTVIDSVYLLTSTIPLNIKSSGGTSIFYIDETTQTISIGGAVTTSKLNIGDTVLSGSGSLAGSLVNLTQTWNTTGTPTAVKLNVTDTTSNASSILLDLQVGGVSKFKVQKGGALTSSGLVAGIDLRAAAGNDIYWSGRSVMASSSDGNIVLYNASKNNFSLLQLGGTTSSFPAIKRSSANLQVRLADDTAYSDLEVADEAYGSGWNGSNEVPTKNAVYDKIETISSGDVYALTAKPTTYYTYHIPMFAKPDSNVDDAGSAWVVNNISTSSQWLGAYSVITTSSTNAFLTTDDSGGEGTFPGSGSTIGYKFDSTKKSVMSIRFKANSGMLSGGSDWCFGIGNGVNANWYTADVSSGGDRAVFMYDGGTTTFKTLTDTGAAVTTNTVSATLSDWNTFRIEFDPGSAVRFYINGTLVATHTTNLPNGGAVLIGAGQTDSTKTWYMSSPTMSIEL